MKKTTRSFVIGVVLTLFMVYGPTALSALLNRLRPAVSRDWVKARCHELVSSGYHPKQWRSVGDDRWYFDAEHFGVRRFQTTSDQWILVISPDGDGPRAYLLTSAGELFESTDDAMSVNCEWAAVRDSTKANWLSMYPRVFRRVE